jgi:uncharacterized protein YcbX
MSECVGSVRHLRRYPVKSFRGEDLEQVLVTRTGLAGDRIYAFVEPSKVGTSRPWLTARQVPEMILFKPRFLEEAPTRALEVIDPEGGVHRIDDPAFTRFLEDRWKRPLELRYTELSMHDTGPVSIFGTATLSMLEKETGLTLDHRRFRANLYVQWAEDRPLREEELLTRRLRVGAELELTVARKNQRCVIITLDPETAASDPRVLKNVGLAHAGCVGVYAVIEKPGVVRAGDPIFLV